ncbi:MAG: Gfo/Idh/MocA family oxidoreductase [Bifidobacteriaceae bacterium]|jgi:predicted dehydrogenase|nr:Gfo/Idh/MocA family oxidoreductase [Bifidobacteriaceae bacterium]
MKSVLRVAMNGVTGRMGYHQHLTRSVLPIRDQGGITLSDGSTVAVEPILVGRNAGKLAEISARHQVETWSADLDRVLADPTVDVYFDAQATSQRFPALASAMRAGKAVYAEKPTAATFSDALALVRLAQEAGVVSGVVHDKLYLPGLRKLRRLVDEGFFGRILSLRGEFGYWVFEGDLQPAQRPSWNFRREAGGSITVDMFSHWSYVLEGVIGSVDAVTARLATHIPKRWDERDQPYEATADDAAYAIFELTTADGDSVIAQINSSWTVRVHRRELVEFQVDGTLGSAVAGLFSCVAQPRSLTPMPVWNPDEPVAEHFLAQWREVPDRIAFGHGFRSQWEEYLRDVAMGKPHRHGFASAARGMALAEAALRSSAEGRRVEPELVEFGAPCLTAQR